MFLRGRWKESREALEASSTRIAQGRAYWQNSSLLFAMRSLYFSGHIKELARRHARVVADADGRGDLSTKVNVATTTGITSLLAADDPEGARRQAREALDQWSQRAFFVQHWQAMAFVADIDLYMGRGAQAYEDFKRQLSALKRSLLLNVQFVRGVTHYTQGRCAIASLESHPELRRVRVSEARRMARRLRREHMPWTTPLAAIVKAAAENAAGDRDAATASLRVAVASGQAAGMAMHVIAARHRLGALTGGEEGRSMVELANQAMTAEGIKNPARWLSIYLPGTWAP
jgi:hypothetical protein